MPLPSSRVGNKRWRENAASIICGVPRNSYVYQNIMGLVPLPIAPPLRKKHYVVSLLVDENKRKRKKIKAQPSGCLDRTPYRRCPRAAKSSSYEGLPRWSTAASSRCGGERGPCRLRRVHRPRAQAGIASRYLCRRQRRCGHRPAERSSPAAGSS